MTTPRCHILFSFRQGPWGGSNSFLTGLRDHLAATGSWADTPAGADVVIFDSFNDAKAVIAWKRRLPEVAFVHRVNGPISRYRGRDLHVDRLIHALSEEIADGVIFQSDYSRSSNIALGMRPARSTVVHNAARDDIFFRPPARTPRTGKVHIVISSWSPHPNKGFDVYSHIDSNLDFDRFEVTFIGKSPVAFKRITCIPPQESSALAGMLRSGDLFLTASRHESCSNAILEAIACGLPVLALRSGSSPELVAGAGRLFSGTGDVIEAIDAIAAERDRLAAGLGRRSLADAAGSYLQFCAEVLAAARPPRRLGAWGHARIQGWLARRQVHLGLDKLRRLSGRTHDPAA